MICAHCGECATADVCTACGPALLDGRYRLLSVLAEGRHCITYTAEVVEPDGTGDLRVAVKELPLWRVRDQKTRELFEREAAVLRQLDHPAIPRWIDTFGAGRGKQRALYLVQELVEGETLAQEMLHRRYRGPDVLEIVEELLDVLAYLHTLSPPIIHRDLKPSNVMRRPDGRIVLVDFGSVLDALESGSFGGSTVAGTFGYMAPEQFRGQALPATDLYGLGVLAAVLLTRKEPHEMVDATGQLQWRRHANVDGDVAALIEDFVQMDWRSRPRDVGEALARLGHVREEVRYGEEPVAKLSIRDTRDVRPVLRHLFRPGQRPRVKTMVPNAPVIEITEEIPELPIPTDHGSLPVPTQNSQAPLAATLLVVSAVPAMVLALAIPLLSSSSEPVPVAAQVATPVAAFAPVPARVEAQEQHLPPAQLVSRIENIGERIENDISVQHCFVAHETSGHQLVQIAVGRSGYVHVDAAGFPTSLGDCVVAAANRLDLVDRPSLDSSTWPVVISRQTWTYGR